ncbi:sensor histidine kinase [Dictyobacter arantiisoli]|uniref:Histidine kinase domain-containing protein n=1 Tax=Dictyobacter arantiisoli TaxID=2014874 RepID=A0A5A5T7K2_9CHLR|nr:sensor histidine kinase [Dictyobacter arantiisoli]GCF06983.1 hypothetical protein KDI_05470 [Dictyobacter arantiisoli]
MASLLRGHLENSFLLLWLLLVYLWIVLLFFSASLPASSLLFTTLLFAGHIVLYGGGTFFAQRGYQRPLILIGLIGSVILLGSLVRNANILLGLYLALCVEAFYLLGQTRITAGCIVVCLLLFWINLKSIHNSFGFGYNFIPPLLFIGGFVVLQAQQTNVHRRTQILLRELEEAHNGLKSAHAQLTAYALQLESLTREAERHRLARELHDTQSQGLVGLLLQLEAINSHLTHQRYERASTLVVQAIYRSRDTLAAARQAIDDLRANGISPSDLPEAVQEEIDHLVTTTNIHCHSDLPVLSLVPASFCEYTLRVITEGLTNIARHAQATEARVCALSNNTGIIVEISDNGIGFDPLSAEQLVGHYGLLGLRERAHLIQGQFEVISSPGKGTTLRFALPQIKERTNDNRATDSYSRGDC